MNTGQIQMVNAAADTEVYEVMLEPSDWIPNNQALPVLVYRAVLAPCAAANGFEPLFAQNGWTGIWRNGVYDYHHYHTGAHEVLGIAAGSATLAIGGSTGSKIEVTAGDCLVLPAGTGHRNLGASSDLAVVGAYPPGQHADIQTSASSNQDLTRIATLPLPEADPVEGPEGYLTRAWANE